MKNTFKIILLIITAVFVFPVLTHGAGLTSLSDYLSSLKKFSNSNHTIQFTTQNGATTPSSTIVLTFPSGFDLSAEGYTDISLSHGPTGVETEETIAATATNTSWGANFSGQSLTLTHPASGNGNITAGDIIIVKIGTNVYGGSHQIQNGDSGNYLIKITGSFGDSGDIPITILDNDQILADGDIIPTISLVLSNPSTSFGLVDFGVITNSSPDITLTITTNHANGYTVKVYDQGDGVHPGLYKPLTGSIPAQIISSADPNYDQFIDLNSVISGYGIQAKCTTGCNTDTEIDSRYRQTGDSIGGLSLIPQTLIQYGTYLTDPHILKITHKAKVSEYAKTGQYTDSIIYQATANF